MRKKHTFKVLIILMLVSFDLYAKNDISNKYSIIHVVKEYNPNTHEMEIISKINQDDISRLSSSLKALAAYYSCLAGSDCDLDGDKEICQLTKALGYGAQGSDEHIAVLKKWFPDDKVVSKFIDDECYLTISGSNYFSNYSYLRFEQSMDTVKVSYQIDYYSRGQSVEKKYEDLIVIKDNHVKFIKRDKKQ